MVTLLTGKLRGLMDFEARPYKGMTLSQVASATSTGATITGPASIQAGDLLVLWDRAFDSGGPLPSTVVPTGFTSISNVNDGVEIRAILSYKIADGSEASASLTGMSGATDVDKALYVFRGDPVIETATPLDVEGQIVDTNPTSHTVGASAGAVPLVIIAGYATADFTEGGPIDPRTFSPAKDGEITPATDLYLAYKIYNSSPADVTVDMDDEGINNTLVTCYIEAS